jgi:DNA-binding transcriptional regulator LsrR (DeoR family)
MKQITDLYQGICGLFAIIYNQTGKLRAQPFTDRLVGLTIEELRIIPLWIRTAGSLSKSAAIQRNLRGGYLFTMITDETTIRDMMELQAIPQGG